MTMNYSRLHICAELSLPRKSIINAMRTVFTEFDMLSMFPLLLNF